MEIRKTDYEALSFKSINVLCKNENKVTKESNDLKKYIRKQVAISRWKSKRK